MCLGSELVLGAGSHSPSVICCYYPLSALAPWKSPFWGVIVGLFSLEALPWDTVACDEPRGNASIMELSWKFPELFAAPEQNIQQ